MTVERFMIIFLLQCTTHQTLFDVNEDDWQGVYSCHGHAHYTIIATQWVRCVLIVSLWSIIGSRCAKFDR